MYVFSLSAASVLHNDVNRILFLGGHFPTLAQLCQREYFSLFCQRQEYSI